MENASRALIMAAGVLIGVLILTLMVVLFSSASSFSKEYDETKHEESVQRFNAYFLKYIGVDKKLTIHDVVTICNYADKYGVEVTSGEKTKADILNDVEDYTPDATSIKKYKLEIVDEKEGYITKIKLTSL